MRGRSLEFKGVFWAVWHSRENSKLEIDIGS